MASGKKSKRPPATTIEARERQLVNLATDLAEKQMADGTASSQVITHYLKLGTVREELEREKIRRETKLLDARVEDISHARQSDEMFADAINAMRMYQGEEPPSEYTD